MKQVLVICKTDKQYLYFPNSIHRVNQKFAQYICDELNRIQYDFTGGGCQWYLMPESDFAPYEITRRFAIRGGHGKKHLSDEYID